MYKDQYVKHVSCLPPYKEDKLTTQSSPKPDAKSADPPTEPEQHDQPDSEDNGSIKYGDSDDSDHLEDYIDPKDPDYQPAHRTRRNQGPKALSAGFSCDKCNKHFQSQRARLQHYRTSAAHLVCNHGCNDTTEHASIADLRLHWQRVHRATYCYFCDRHFANSDKRQMHMEREHHPCRQCNLFYRSEDKLREHWKTSAKHQNTYCGICELEFETAEFLILVRPLLLLLLLLLCLLSPLQNETKRLIEGSTNPPATSPPKALQPTTISAVIARRTRKRKARPEPLLRTIMPRLGSAVAARLHSKLAQIETDAPPGHTKHSLTWEQDRQSCQRDAYQDSSRPAQEEQHAGSGGVRRDR